MKPLLLVLLAAVPCLPQTATSTPDPIRMNDADVVQMVQAHVPPNLIILAISQCEPHFLLQPGYSGYMLEVGVTYDIFKAMAAKQAGRTVHTQPQAVPEVAQQAAPLQAEQQPTPLEETATDVTKTHGDHHILKGVAAAAITIACAQTGMNPAVSLVASQYCQQYGLVVAKLPAAAQVMSVATSSHVLPATRSKKPRKPKKST